MTAFVTVGTTRFDDLINEVLRPECLQALRSAGISSLNLQIGASDIDEEIWQHYFSGISTDFEGGASKAEGLKITFYRYKPSLAEDMANAKLVIGHAGAGTVLECMRLRKPLIVVINTKLMNNHQSELAEELGKGNHLLFCEPSGLSDAIRSPKLFNLNPFDPPDLTAVARHIDKRVGLFSNTD